MKTVIFLKSLNILKWVLRLSGKTQRTFALKIIVGVRGVVIIHIEGLSLVLLSDLSQEHLQLLDFFMYNLPGCEIIPTIPYLRELLENLCF